MDEIHVLFVDDSEFFVNMVVDKVRSREIQTRTAVDAAGALSTLQNHRVDCVVSDYNMPDVDGLELYQKIDGRFDVSFVLLTGQGNESVASEAIRSGVDDYLQKEAVMEEEQIDLLINRIRNVVSRNRTQRKYERLLDNTPDEIVEVTTDGEITAANQAMAMSFGIDRDAIVGKRLSEVLPEAVASDRLDHGRRALTAGSAVTFQDRIGVRQFHNIVMPLSGASGTHSMQFISREITQQKRSEEELEAKTEKLTLINRLVRHDINNDVQLLMAWADALRTHTDDSGQEYLDRLSATADHISDLTSTARDFIDTLEEDDVEYPQIDVSPILRTEIDKKRERFEEAQYTIEGTLDSVSVSANELLSSVYGNLLSNAVRHNDKDTPRVSVATETDGEMVTVIISDNGPGVPDDQKSEIFRVQQDLRSCHAPVRSSVPTGVGTLVTHGKGGIPSLYQDGVGYGEIELLVRLSPFEPWTVTGDDTDEQLAADHTGQVWSVERSRNSAVSSPDGPGLSHGGE